VSQLTQPEDLENHVFHLFVITSHERNRLSAFLKDRGVETLIHYPIPIHMQKPAENVRRDPKGLGAAEGHAATCLSIPCHPQMSDNDIHIVIEAINAFK
jgi:dTDP-4-amino-4,6-dideoxygalactose transaminase